MQTDNFGLYGASVNHENWAVEYADYNIEQGI